MRIWRNFNCPNTGQSTAIERLASPRSYASGTELFSQGTPVREVFLINRGLVKLTYLAESGRELILCLRSSNWILGAAAAIADKPHPTTAVTLTECEISTLEAGVFLDLMRNDIRFAGDVLRMVSQENWDQMEDTCRLKTFSARARLERLFHRLVGEGEQNESKKERQAPMVLKHKEIAAVIAVSPEHLSRLLKEMEKEGIARIENGILVIPDIGRLIEAADR